MDRITDRIERFIQALGKYSSWLNLALVLLICLDVVQRYLFQISYNWVLDAEWHIFGLVFLLGSAYTLSEDKHVRVDVFYQSFTPRRKAWVNFLGTLVLLVPWCIIAVNSCWHYASNSFYIREGSPSPGGLPALYIIKFCIVICFLLLFTQGVVLLVRNLKMLVR